MLHDVYIQFIFIFFNWILGILQNNNPAAKWPKQGSTTSKSGNVEIKFDI